MADSSMSQPDSTIIDLNVKEHLITTFSTFARSQGIVPIVMIDKLLHSLYTPPKHSTIRLNKHSSTINTLEVITATINKTYTERGATSSAEIGLYPSLDNVIVIRNIFQNGGDIIPMYKRVIIDLSCGSAVLRGADVFGPGVLAATKDVVKGDIVSVFVDVDGGCRKGLATEYNGHVVFVGNGILLQDRNDWFKVTDSKGNTYKGIGVQMTEPLYISPRLNTDQSNDLYYPQNLPSIVVSHVLNALPGETILDMCASPGGKTTHIASLMNNTGCIIAIDKNCHKVSKLLKTVQMFLCSSVNCYVYDSTKLVSDEVPVSLSLPCPPPYKPETFDRILLDGPCSGFGQRPLIRYKLKLSELLSYHKYQQKLIKQAIILLKRGGTLVYSTCSMLPQENEEQVAWILNNYPDIKLVKQEPFIGYPGLLTFGLDQTHCDMVQRFGPTDFYSFISNNNYRDNDSIGFFIAKFIKL